ncbi:pre-rRNA 2'-O-ribose RNA methyltransferase FTSJ3 [Culicoides brevitarsis]|uniref:pre-rRNA 2'-O-ribose RNA methyltransferase FTSJ3 n=1 Tax=Culicoides brevitarsis TaxID=469753 RepID=UPI00307B41C3
MGKKTKIGKDRKDKFYKLAKETGFRSRAAFKLIQLNRKFGFLQQSQVCIDLCAAPGGWMQVAKQNMPVSSIVIGVDLFPIKTVPGCISLIEDITTDKCRSSLTKELKTWKADVILNDGAPNVGKSWIYDAYQQICLTLSAVKLASEFLRPGGWFVTKVFRSKDYNALIWVLKQLFKKVHATKPSASRKESAEIFVVCQSYKAPQKIDCRFFDPKFIFEELDIEPQIKINLLKESNKNDKKAKPKGYENIDVRKILPASEFIAAENGLNLLANTTEIILDTQEIKDHIATTNEIIACCRDIKVLGRKDLREVLKWWKILHEHFYGNKQTNDMSSSQEVVAVAKYETEETELQNIQQNIDEMQLEQERDAKRKKKKANKERSKLANKLNLKMVIQGDSGPTEEGDGMMFSLEQVKNKKELERLIDVEPDLVVERRKKVISDSKSKFVRYQRDEKGDLYEDDSTLMQDEEENSDMDLDQTGKMAFEGSEESNADEEKYDNNIERNRNPLITDLDYRSKDDKRLMKAKLWFEKESFKLLNSDNEKEEDFDLDALTHEYENKGVSVANVAKQTVDLESLGKKAKRRVRYLDNEYNSSSSETEDEGQISEYEKIEKVNGLNGFEIVTTGPKVKKVKLSEEELALGQIIATSRKNRRDATDAAWNRYMFNDESLPDWFIKDEAETMKKGTLIPEELVQNYRKRVEEMNVRSIKKVIEAKSRKKRRGLKRLEKVKKKAETILENVDNTNQEKIRALKKLYRKADNKKKEITYVVAKRTGIAGKKVRRPKGVEGRFKVVDPRLKKDKRGMDAVKRRKIKKSKAKK